MLASLGWTGGFCLEACLELGFEGVWGELECTIDPTAEGVPHVVWVDTCEAVPYSFSTSVHGKCVCNCYRKSLKDRSLPETGDYPLSATPVLKYSEACLKASHCHCHVWGTHLVTAFQFLGNSQHHNYRAVPKQCASEACMLWHNQSRLLLYSLMAPGRKGGPSISASFSAALLYQIRGNLRQVKKAKVTVSLVTKDIPHRPHPHSLVGKDCNDGICVINLNLRTHPKHRCATLPMTSYLL